MVVVVDARYMSLNELEGYGHFSKEIIQRLTTQYSEHQFHLLFDRERHLPYSFPGNVQRHVISPQVRHPLQWKYWYDLKLPLFLKKVKADVFLASYGQCSLHTKVPQCLVVHDLAFLHFPEAYKKREVIYLKHYMPHFIAKAKTVITVSQFSKKDLINHYKTDEATINVVYNGIRDIFVPTTFNEQLAVKEKYTAGTEFFLYTGAVHPRKNLINLLKAFSIFKRRLKSSMKLVLAGRLAWKNDEFLTLLKTYKYKEDVLLTGYLSEAELAALMASAYAFVYPSLFEGFGVPVIEAMKCGVPVLTSAQSAMHEISNGAALYFDPLNIDDIADKLMMVYKDESGRKILIEKGFVVAEKYTWQQTADAIWESLLKTAAGK